MTPLMKNIARISDEILESLLAYRMSNSDFTFALRKRDSVQSDEKRLQNGYWFQGSFYIYVPLFKKGDSSRKIKTLGFVITFEENGEIQNNYIEISFKGGIDDPNEIQFHQELAEKLGVVINNQNFGSIEYDDPNQYIKNLKNYIEETRPIAMELLQKYNISDKYIIPEEEFNRDLTRTLGIRDQLKKARGITPNENILLYDSPLNHIFYGPPGTGKTYHTINKALEILGEDIDELNRADIKKIFQQKVTEGQIVFTTFHQSMSYEDFIEGIKPLKSPKGDGSIFYDIQPGIFYSIARKARDNYELSKEENKSKQDFEEAISQLIEEWEEDPIMKFPMKTQGKEFEIIGFTEKSIQFKKSSGGTGHTLSKSTLKEYYYGLSEVPNLGLGIYYAPVIAKLHSYAPRTRENVTYKNYVIIIDEINRGNISQIFGELITLIEEDKRVGKEEALEITLPYSKEPFSVPPNLHIIGTMNTADRSVEALDTALRRRFSFQEMPPQPDLIRTEGKSSETDGIVEGINLVELLETINKRIEKLLDRDHLIGHSYFLSVEDISGLQKTFQNKIIPLLQEYFYGDYGKLGLVLGKGFVEDNNQENDPNIFAGFDDEYSNDYSDRKIYTLKNLDSFDEFKEAIATLLKIKKP